jgi:putative N-acetyltransferase (TIGR04045 family)
VTAVRLPSSPTVQSGATCESVRTAADLDLHYEIRRRVFVTEQRVFPNTDRDEHDDDVRTVHVLGRVDGHPAGAVRLFPVAASADIWQGDRLCVLPEFRTCGIGGPLVRYAVAAAGAAGGTAMVAHIQLPNVTFFKHLGWTPDGEVEIYVGLPHQPMHIALPSQQDAAQLMREWAAR